MEKTSPKPFVFVLMPFDKEFDDVYHLGIKPACMEAGAYAERVNEQIFHESILDRIYNQISKADVIIADMTGRNPNVFYETGYAHALGKPVILLTRTVDDIPFDLQHYPHIIYKGSISDLIPELIKRVAFAIEKPKDATQKVGVDVYVNGNSIITNNKLVVPEHAKDSSSFILGFDFHNAAYNQLKTVSFQIGFVTFRALSIMQRLEGSREQLTKYKQPDGISTLFMSSRPFEILPSSWEKAVFDFYSTPRKPYSADEKIEFVLRIFTEEGACDFPFTVEV